MSLRGIRRALRAEPRWILVALLAFAIETLPAASALVSHRHAGGGNPHAHVGPIAGVRAEAALDDGGPAQRDGVRRAPSGDLHQHTVQPVVAMRAATPASPAPSLHEGSVPRVPVASIRAVARRLGQARAPPIHSA